MSISLKTHKLLWGRSGNMCAFPGCRKILVVDKTSSDDPSIIGEEAHVVAKKEDGPRGKSDLTEEQRDKYDNLILLCNEHHKIIDDQQNEYTIKKLHSFKIKHETWVKENLNEDPKKNRDDELYATYIEKFISLADIHNWNSWTSFFFGSTEIFLPEQFESLKQLPNYIVSRIWPKRYSKLEDSLFNFKNILNDIIKVYYKYPERLSDGYGVKKFYKDFYFERVGSNNYSLELEREALAKYDFHVELMQDLLLELTRAANYVCDNIRENIFEGFRIEDGELLISSNDFFKSSSYKTEYRGEERNSFPYPGLREFMIKRRDRDLKIGAGISNDYFD
jgi:hypothetical protein